jgi:transcription-repair coupling factor (superfamily II helicase)
LFAQIAETFASRSERPPGTRAHPVPAPPEKLYLRRAEWDGAISRKAIATADASQDGRVPRFARERNPKRALTTYLAEHAGDRIVLIAVAERDLRTLVRVAERALGKRPTKVERWSSVATAEPGSVLALTAPLDAGFVLPSQHITAIAVADLIGSRAGRGVEQSAALITLGRADLGIGDAVVHIDHGMAALEGLEQILPARR